MSTKHRLSVAWVPLASLLAVTATAILQAQWGDPLQILGGGQVTSSGIITRQETWSGNVFLSGDVTIRTNGSVTILPGTRIEADARFDDQIGGMNPSRIEIIVDGGILDAQGTAEGLIVFTPSVYPPQTVPQKGDWYGLRIVNSDRVVLHHCLVEYGVQGLRAERGSPVVEHCRFENHQEHGVRLNTSATLSGCTMNANNVNGLSMLEGKIVSLVNSTVSWNGGDGVSGSGSFSGCTISNNGGSGIIGNAYVAGSTISNNAKYGISAQPSGTVTVVDSFVQNNGWHGVVVWPEGTATVAGTEISHNSASANVQGWDIPQRGGLAVGNGTATITSSRLTDNAGNGVLAGEYGNRAVISVYDSVVRGNTGVGIGGWYSSAWGRWFVPQWVKVVRCTIMSNGSGGVLGLSVEAANSTISSNGGEGLYGWNSAIATESTFSGNALRGIAATTLSLNNCVITDQDNGPGAAFNNLGAGGLTGNLIRGNASGILIQFSGSVLSNITGNVICTNRDTELQNSGPGAVIADGNYWGEPTTTELNNHVRNLTKIYDARDDANVGAVYIRTWSEAAEIPLEGPAITQQPQSQTATAGDSVTLSVTATGPEPLTYEWQKDGTDIAGATNATLVISNVSTNDAGKYYVIVRNGLSAISLPATLTVYPATAPIALDLMMYAGITVPGTVGRTYEIQYSTTVAEPRSWLPLTRILLPASPYVVIDWASPGVPKRFYRAVEQP